MNANEMADELEQQLDRGSSFGSPGYEDFELSSVLTEAQHLYIKKFFDEINNRKQQGFQETEVRNQGLSALIKKGDSLTWSIDQTGTLGSDRPENLNNILGEFFDLPTDCMYIIYEQCTIANQSGCSGSDPLVADVKVVSYNEINRLIRNKYKKPFYKRYGEAMVWRTEFSRFNSGRIPTDTKTVKRVQIITDGTFLVGSGNYNIVYLKDPLDIIVDRTTSNSKRNCELDDSTHRVIIAIAKDLMMERVKEQIVKNNESLRDLE